MTSVERMVEALLFAAAGPLSAEDLVRRLPEGADVASALETLQGVYAGRGSVRSSVIRCSRSAAVWKRQAPATQTSSTPRPA